MPPPGNHSSALLADHDDISPLGSAPTSRLDKMAQLESYIPRESDLVQRACACINAWRVQTNHRSLKKAKWSYVYCVERERTLILLCCGTINTVILDCFQQAI